MIKKYKWNIDLIVGTVIIGCLFFIMLVSFFYTPYDPESMDLVNKLSGPSKGHLLGTDQFGRDVLSRIMVGSQTVFMIGFGTVTLSFIGGSVLGILSGYYGGFIDACIMKLIESQMAFPGMLLALMLISIFKPSLWVIILALSLMNTPRFTRIVRGGYLQFKSAEFVLAAQVAGLPTHRIMLKHIFPNISTSILVTATLSFATAILSEAGLSYLGLGLQPPLASWGKMLGEAQTFMLHSPLLAIIPGVMITLTVIGFNLLAEGIRKQL